MISSDIGSMPLRIEKKLLLRGARRVNSLIPYLGVYDEDYQIFKKEVATAFADKIKAGVEVPNYPQFRDMNEMFFDLMEGIEKTETGLSATGTVKARRGSSIPETMIIKNETNKIRDITGVDKVRVRICVTGPYTLSSFFQTKSPNLCEELGCSISAILSESMFNIKHANTVHVCIDEPTLGFMNDPLLDYGSAGRESLRKAWEGICVTAVSHGADTSMHLHNTSETLMWDVEHLGTIASHVGDPMYTQESTKEHLEEKDKHLWAAIGVTQFDNLIYLHYYNEGFRGNFPEKIGEVWTQIRKGLVDPIIFIENKELMRKRINKIVDYFGPERVKYSSPECGLNSFPSYELALEYLNRSAEAAIEYNSDSKR
jgi:5-methyltetrahydropteroyltriglutamate--homocysteine methyltransferase